MNNFTVSLLITLKNASLSNKGVLKIKTTKNCLPYIRVLYKKGYIQSFKTFSSLEEENHTLTLIVYFRYYFNNSLLENLKIISTPTKKKILSLKDISRLFETKTTVFLSTTLGVQTLIDCKKYKKGGIALFKC